MGECCGSPRSQARLPLEMRGLSLEQFKEIDKVRLMTVLFENQDFLNALYQVMFWQKPEPPAKPVF